MNDESLLFFGITFISLAIYLFPSAVASGRHHHQTLAILMLNLLLGWTLLGWIVALIWACTAVKPNVNPRT